MVSDMYRILTPLHSIAIFDVYVSQQLQATHNSACTFIQPGTTPAGQNTFIVLSRVEHHGPASGDATEHVWFPPQFVYPPYGEVRALLFSSWLLPELPQRLPGHLTHVLSFELSMTSSANARPRMNVDAAGLQRPRTRRDCLRCCNLVAVRPTFVTRAVRPRCGQATCRYMFLWWP